LYSQEGRSIIYPSFYEAAEGPFRLKDPTRPGHRKLLTLSLVDPTCQIPSTYDVDPQDPSWFDQELLKMMEERLPPELQDMVEMELWSFSPKEAERIRESAFRERLHGYCSNDPGDFDRIVLT
jgi:hypothetical protein